MSATTKQRTKLASIGIAYSDAFQYIAIMWVLREYFEMPEDAYYINIVPFEKAKKNGLLKEFNVPTIVEHSESPLIVSLLVGEAKKPQQWMSCCCWDCPDHHERHKVDPTPASAMMMMVLEMSKCMAN